MLYALLKNLGKKLPNLGTFLPNYWVRMPPYHGWVKVTQLGLGKVFTTQMGNIITQ